MLERELADREGSLAAAERFGPIELKKISDLLYETQRELQEAKVAIEKLQRDAENRIDAPTLHQTRSHSVAPSAFRSRRPYVCLIIDGDANHFLPALLKAGGRGGEAAAERLKQEVSKFIAERRCIPQSCMVKVQIFMNRAGFVQTVHRHDQTPKNIINSCLDRLFQSQPTWDLVDTGSLRESADTKIKANFHFFVNDSDCFGMIMGVCSDNGYVQLLQEFQGDPEKMSKIVLLTSCNTVINIQNLTYAIVQWPNVFRSKPISRGRCNGIAGPQIKGVTPLEECVRLADRDPIVANSGRLIRTLSGRKLPKRQVTPLPANPKGAPSAPRDHSLSKVSSSKPAQRQVSHQQQQESGNTNEDCTISFSVSDGHGAAAINVAVSPCNGAERTQLKQNTSEDPDCELTHDLETPLTLAQRDSRPMCLTRRLLPKLNAILPCTGSVMGTIISSIAGKSAFHSLNSSNHTPFQNSVGKTHGNLMASSHVNNHVDSASHPIISVGRRGKSTQNPGTLAHSHSQQGASTVPAPLSSRQIFIHIPMPNRSQRPTYDPERYLFQQSQCYLTYNHQALGQIVAHARKYHQTVPKPARPRLRHLLQVADFIVTRLWLAQELQSLEDRAIEKQLRCSPASTSCRGDAWCDDWDLYCAMATAMRWSIDPALVKLSSRVARGALAEVDWPLLLLTGEVRACTSERETVVQTPCREKVPRRSRRHRQGKLIQSTSGQF